MAIALADDGTAADRLGPAGARAGTGDRRTQNPKTGERNGQRI
jgi:hypothetical protein